MLESPTVISCPSMSLAAVGMPPNGAYLGRSLAAGFSLELICYLCWLLQIVLLIKRLDVVGEEQSFPLLGVRERTEMGHQQVAEQKPGL